MCDYRVSLEDRKADLVSTLRTYDIKSEIGKVSDAKSKIQLVIESVYTIYESVDVESVPKEYLELIIILQEFVNGTKSELLDYNKIASQKTSIEVIEATIEAVQENLTRLSQFANEELNSILGKIKNK